MKKISQRLHQLFIRHLQIPEEVILGLPKITVVGSIHAYIENHQGLLVYSDNEIRLKITNGSIRIIGESFVLKALLPSEIILEGSIKEVKYIED